MTTKIMEAPGGRVTVKSLREWLALLPPECDSLELEGAVGPIPCTAKRIIAYRYKDGSGGGLVVNPMGTHLGDDFYAAVEIISTHH